MTGEPADRDEVVLGVLRDAGPAPATDGIDAVRARLGVSRDAAVAAIRAAVTSPAAAGDPVAARYARALRIAARRIRGHEIPVPDWDDLTAAVVERPYQMRGDL